MKSKILLVDDEQNILDAYTRHLRFRYDVTAVNSGKDGLISLKEKGPFEAVVTDFRMPEINGIQFLSAARQISPDTVRIMLTGHADMQSAIDAVNEGSLFRFLTKPCPTDIFLKTIKDAIDQYKLIIAERELLEKTLRGSIKVFIDILSIVNPIAFSQVSRIRQTAKKIMAQLKLENVWEVELAAMLSQIGCVTIPVEVLNKKYKGEALTTDELNMIISHPQIGKQLIENIPRLEKIAEAIAYQEKQYDGGGYPQDSRKGVNIPLIARILKASIDFNNLLTAGRKPTECIKLMQQNLPYYDPDILGALEAEVKSIREGFVIKTLSIEEVKPGMVLAEDVIDKLGNPLITKKNVITDILKMRLQNYISLGNVIEFVKVIEKVTRVE